MYQKRQIIIGINTLILTISGCMTASETETANLDETSYLVALQEEQLEASPSETERERAHQDKGKLGLSSIDLNIDCSLDGIRDRLLQRFDGDASGDLDTSEEEHMNAEMFEVEENAVSNPSEEEEASAEGDLDSGESMMRCEKGKKGKRAKLKKVIWLYDADESNSLDEAEKSALETDLQARCENIKAYYLANFDDNGDGQIDEDENSAIKDAKQAAREARRIAKVTHRFNEIDTNDDNLISEEEMQAVQAARDVERETNNSNSREIDAEKRVEKRAERFASTDTDQDGSLSLDEFTTTPSKRKHFPGKGKRSKLKKPSDSDQDGTLSEEEKEAMKAELKARIRGERIAEEFATI